MGLNREIQGEIRWKSERLKELQEREGPEVMDEIKKLQSDLSNILDQEDLK